LKEIVLLLQFKKTFVVFVDLVVDVVVDIVVDAVFAVVDIVVDAVFVIVDAVVDIDAVVVLDIDAGVGVLTTTVVDVAVTVKSRKNKTP